jgi:energy-coupling factor transporter ATP-binding protein EcfA2
MSTISNPYSKKSHSGDYGIYFNLLYFYVEKYSAHPHIYEFSMPIKNSSFEKIEKLGAKRIFSFDLEKFKDNEQSIENMEACYEYEDILIFFYRRESFINRIEYLKETEEDEDFEEEVLDKDFGIYKCKILYQSENNLNKIKEAIDKDLDKKQKGNVYLLCTMDGMLSLQKFDIKLPQKEIDLDFNYGQEAAKKFNKIASYLDANKNGLILLSGDPGTGKSTFIKYLTTKTKRKVIYLSSGAVEQLTNPDFLSFMMMHRNSILLLEDAEKVLRSRDSQDNDAISNILNITDGILGDCLNILVIATFNIDREKIDSALVRKGRLLLEHYFKALSVEDSNKLLNKIGSSKKTDVPMTLAEIYNEEDNFHEKKEQKRVGF